MNSSQLINLVNGCTVLLYMYVRYTPRRLNTGCTYIKYSYVHLQAYKCARCTQTWILIHQFRYTFKHMDVLDVHIICVFLLTLPYNTYYIVTSELNDPI